MAEPLSPEAQRLVGQPSGCSSMTVSQDHAPTASIALEGEIDAAILALNRLTGYGEDAVWRPADRARSALIAAREALRIAHVETAEALIRRLDLTGQPDSSRLVVMAQNPANNHHWSLSVGKFTAGEVRAAITKAEGK